MDVCEEYQKEQKLPRLLGMMEELDKILVFTEYKQICDVLTRYMKRQEANFYSYNITIYQSHDFCD